MKEERRYTGKAGIREGAIGMERERAGGKKCIGEELRGLDGETAGKRRRRPG